MGSQQVEDIESEYEEIENNNAWNEIYQKIRSESLYDLDCNEAKSPVNRNLNRYRDVLPYDHSRIILQGVNPNYINASLLKVKRVQRSYILTQGPLPPTTPHFWLMVYQQNTKGIIMLNKIIEKDQIKCHQYWPLGEENGGEDTQVFSTVGLKVELVTQERHSHYIYRILKLTDISSKDSRMILHFHYTTWPDFGVPQSPEAFYKFLNVVRASQCLSPDVGPAVVHCSAGIGRSGTFCLVDSLLLMLSKGMGGKVLEVLLDMRHYRMGLIQTPDQLRFSYQAIIYGAHRQMETNGLGEETGSSSEEPSLVEELPPQPPPRGDSLTRSMLESQLQEELNAEGSDTQPEEDDCEEDPPDKECNKIEDAPARPLPQEPDSVDCNSSVETSSRPSPQYDNDVKNEVRKRKHQEKIEAVSSKIKTIKEKQQAAERWQERKRLIMRPISICLALAAISLGGGALYLRFFHG